MGLSKLFSRIKRVFSRKSAHDQPCVLLKYTTITDENRPCQVDERPVEEDYSRWTWTKTKRCLRWHSRRKKYSVAKAERVNQITGPIKRPTEEHICLQYKIGDKLGQGGFGSVHRGVRVKDGLEVAVKFAQKTTCVKYINTPFHPNPLPSEIALSLMASRNPGCPHIIRLLDWQDDPDNYIMVMERPLLSMDMSMFLRCNGGVLKECKTQFIMWQVVYAANFCCRRGVFHRDIKLQNLLVNPNTLEVKLIDFGCGDLLRRSSCRTFCGTRQYFPPEYFELGKYHAKPATVYSLGVLMFTILQGRFPRARDMRLLSKDQSTFNFSQECCQLMWTSLQHRPECRIRLEHMQYDNWFVMDFPGHQSHDQNADAIRRSIFRQKLTATNYHIC